MKRILLTWVALGTASVASAQEPIIPPIEVGDVTIKPHGWTWTTIGNEREDQILSMARLRLGIETETPVDAFVELDVTRGVDGDENWLRQAYVSYTPSEKVTVRVGRLFLAAPLATPPPFLLPTVDYPRYPFSAFAWGAQVRVQDGDWSVTADVTANSHSRFNERESLNGIESSGRLAYNVSDRLQVGGTYQVSGDYQRFSTDATLRPADGHTVNVVAYKTFGEKAVTGGFLFYGYNVEDGIEPHVQLDFQKGAEHPLIGTAGVRLTHDRFQLIGDINTRGQIAARLQFRF